MRSVGVCASDVQFWKMGKLGDLTMARPYILGHECSGVISKVGEGVANVKVGKGSYFNRFMLYVNVI